MAKREPFHRDVPTVPGYHRGHLCGCALLDELMVAARIPKKKRKEIQKDNQDSFGMDMI